MKILNNLINKNNYDRMQEIVNYLKNVGIKYNSQLVDSSKGLENIIIDYSKNKRYVLVIAHYDCVQGSQGANDNASGVEILLNVLADQLIQNLSVKFVFTALEEEGGIGCNYYLKKEGINNIYSVINVDSCGWGDSIVIKNHSIFDDMVLQNVLREVKGIFFTKFLPCGDDTICEEFDVPTIAISTMKERDYQCFKKIGDTQDCVLSKEELENLQREYFTLDLFKTMHCGTMDDFKNINVEILEKVQMVVKKILALLLCN